MSKLIVASEISRDISQVFFASVFVDPIVKGAFDVGTISLGLLLAIIGWLVSIVLIK